MKVTGPTEKNVISANMILKNNRHEYLNLDTGCCYEFEFVVSIETSFGICHFF